MDYSVLNASLPSTTCFSTPELSEHPQRSRSEECGGTPPTLPEVLKIE